MEGVTNTGEVDLLKLGVGAPLPTMCDIAFAKGCFYTCEQLRFNVSCVVIEHR